MSEEKVEALNAAGLDHLQVSVDGVEPNEVTVKTLKPLRPKLEMLARVREVQDHALRRDRQRRRRRRAGGGALREGARLPPPRPTDPRTGRHARPRPGQAGRCTGGRRGHRQRFTEAHDYRCRLLAGKPAPFKCRAGSRYLYVDEFGVAHWCSQKRERFGIPLAQYSAADLRRQFLTRKGCEAHCTVGCARTNSARDEWRPQTFAPGPPPSPAPAGCRTC